MADGLAALAEAASIRVSRWDKHASRHAIACPGQCSWHQLQPPDLPTRRPLVAIL
jgi:hypothetical protein